MGNKKIKYRFHSYKTYAHILEVCIEIEPVVAGLWAVFTLGYLEKPYTKQGWIPKTYPFPQYSRTQTLKSVYACVRLCPLLCTPVSACVRSPGPTLGKTGTP
jgi:hypothetical protein